MENNNNNNEFNIGQNPENSQVGQPVEEPVNVQQEAPQVEAQVQEAAPQNEQQNQQFNAGAQGGQYQYNAGQQNQQFNNGAQGQYQYNNGQQFNGQQNQQFNGNQYDPNGYLPPEHNKAIAALILSIAGVLCCGALSIVGLVLSNQAKNAGNQEGITKAAFIISIVGLCLWALGIIVSVATGAFTASTNVYY